MYADYAYYTEEYLCGHDAVIQEADFRYYEKRARMEIDQITKGRIGQMDVIPDFVKDCTCEVAELLSKADTITDANMKSGIAGAMTSYSNDGQSGTFDVSQSVYTESGKKKEIQRLCRLYLARTGLLYAGVDHYES